jgi:mannose-1-phosphate guanylyltransferase
VAAGNYFWNSGIFLWSARTLANAVREHLPEMAPLLEKIAAAYANAGVRARFSPSCIPSARTSASTTRCWSRARPRASGVAPLLPAGGVQLERSGLVGLALRVPAGNAAAGRPRGNVRETRGHDGHRCANNYIYSPGKFVALVGVENLVIVDTEDALLIAHRDHSQDVGKIVKELGRRGARNDLI